MCKSFTTTRHSLPTTHHSLFMTNPRYRLATNATLIKGAEVSLRDNAAHYLTSVLRLKEGDAVALFNREDGEWRAELVAIRKKEVVLRATGLLRSKPTAKFQLTVCFAPIKGGRLETIIEKATELGASVLQPVITQRTIVDKVNLERAESIAREAAEQCERLDWPEIREPVKLLKLLGDWPHDLPLIYGDESGKSPSIQDITTHHSPLTTHPSWGILAGPEGGFTPEEFQMLSKHRAARGVSLGPRILRADTAIITLCAATLMAWGDWQEHPRFRAQEEKSHESGAGTEDA